jgi:hypothetical protein
MWQRGCVVPAYSWIDQVVVLVEERLNIVEQTVKVLPRCFWPWPTLQIRLFSMRDSLVYIDPDVLGIFV